MSDEQSGPPSETNNEDPVATWWETCGHPLQNALCWVEKWRHEARGGAPREITYQEFAFRCADHLAFDGEAYVLADGLSEVIAEMGAQGLMRTKCAKETEKSLGPVPRLSYELARHIAQTNQRAGRDLHRSLAPFASPMAVPVKRGRGRSLEDIQLYRTLAWWAVDRGVQLGLTPGKTRERSVQRPRKKTKPAIELTSECFQKSPVHWGNYDNVNEAWLAHRTKEPEEPEKPKRRRLKLKPWMLKLQLNAPVYERRFDDIDDLVVQLPQYPSA